MHCFLDVIQMGRGVLQLTQITMSINLRINSHRNGSQMMSITMRDRSKNRKPLQRGRNLSIEAIQTVQALKRAANQSGVLLDQVFNSKFKRLLKFDMIAVLRELLRQNQCVLALQVFEDVRKEEWYKPQLSLYAEMIMVFGGNKLIDKVESLMLELKSEDNLEPDIEGFNKLLEALIHLKLVGLAMECFSYMKALDCEPDRLSFEILMNGLEENGETDIAAAVLQEARRDYGYFLDFLEKEETAITS